MNHGGAASALPQWLEEHCQRLSSRSLIETNTSPVSAACHSTHDHGISRIFNLNLNLRRLDAFMMQALADALSQNDEIQIINLTSALVSRNHHHRRPTAGSSDHHTHSSSSSSDETLIPLAQLLCHHKSLEVIHLSYNRLTDASCLGRALSTNSSLQELYMDHNQMSGASVVALAGGLARNPDTKLRVLCLNSNRMGDLGGMALAQLLLTNQSLKRLQLTNNMLGGASVLALCQALEQRNVTLIELGLEETTEPSAQSMGAASQQLCRIQQLLQANRSGRYLLQQEPPPPMGLWPLVLEGLPIDPQYYFLQQLPGLVMMTPENLTTSKSEYTY